MKARIGIAVIGALAALAIPATAATASPAVAATATARSAVPDIISVSTIASSYDSNTLLDQGQGHYVAMEQYEGSHYYPIQDGSSKWWEIQDTAGGNQCLDLTGSGSGGVYYVTTELCNFRSAELWWFPSGIHLHNSGGQIINQYGTKLLSHDACLFNNESGIDPKIEKCSSTQYSYQLWLTGF